MSVRPPAVAGTFYAGSRDALVKQIEGCFLHRLGPGKLPEVAEGALKRVVGLVCPHAGYMYSGPVAAHSYYRLASDGRPEVVVILGPNHHGVGSAIATVRGGVWRTPLGDVEVDGEVAMKIVEYSGIVDLDENAHRYEHSIEVQLPFLQYLYGDEFRFVPIAMLMQDSQSSVELGRAIAKALSGMNAVVIASTDLTHYEPQETASKKDNAVIKAILDLDVDSLYKTVMSLNVSMCGYGPAAAAITASREAGANTAKLLSYKTSGDVTGDFSAVVGYAALSIER